MKLFSTQAAIRKITAFTTQVIRNNGVYILVDSLKELFGKYL